MDNSKFPLSVNDWSERQKLHKYLSEMLINVTDKYFENRSIFIDGYRYINCLFSNCTLLINRGTFEFHHSIFRNCKQIYGEEAIKSIQLYTFDFPAWRASPAFGPKSNPDGSLSIGKGVTIE